MAFIFLIPIILIIVIVIVLKDERRNYKNINFKEKKLYLCCKFLHGNCNLKTNKAVLSRNGDSFLLETEDNEGKVESFGFNISEIIDIKVKEGLSSKMSTQMTSNHAMHTSYNMYDGYDYINTFELYKIYDIKIELQNDIHIILISKKDPEYIFKRN